MIDLYTKDSPVECTNFIKLCKLKYYTFAPFYYVKRDLLGEFGDPLYPLSKQGRSVWSVVDADMPAQFKLHRNGKRPIHKGDVSFRVTSQVSNEQFGTSIVSITLGDLDPRKGTLPGVVFGKVVEGLDILDKLNKAIVDGEFRPLQDIRIHRTYVLDDPFEDISGMSGDVPPTPEPSEEQISTIRLDDVEQVKLEDEAHEMTQEEIRERKQREALSKALTLEIIGDLPSAEAKPMENVLFVCKLNRLTRDEDLETIFARFGAITSCEVIRDKSTGESLQYAFVEYEDKKSCEAAYFKMDGALIDDRRIHVDFSQSVSKLANVWQKQRVLRR